MSTSGHTLKTPLAPSFSIALTIANHFDELGRVGLWLEQMARHYQLADHTVFKVDLVLNEVLPNIISYAYSDQLRHDIVITLQDGNDHVFLEIMDDGMGFNPFEQDTPPQALSLESASIQGRGIHLIKSYTEAREYQRVNNKNRMRVVISKSPEPKEPSTT